MIEELFMTHHTKSDGVTYDLTNKKAVGIFDINDPYDLSEMEELNPIKELSFIELAYEVGENNQLKLKTDYGKYYGTLEKGIYRIVKPVYDKHYINLFSNEFEIK